MTWQLVTVAHDTEMAPLPRGRPSGITGPDHRDPDEEKIPPVESTATQLDAAGQEMAARGTPPVTGRAGPSGSGSGSEAEARGAAVEAGTPEVDTGGVTCAPPQPARVAASTTTSSPVGPVRIDLTAIATRAA